MGKKGNIKVFWPLATALFFILFLLSLSLHLWDLKPWGTTIDYQKAGPWADLITGLATMCTALVAFGGIYLESRRARAAEEALERRFNTQVYCWLEPKLIDGKREWFLCFENHIGIPIYEWKVVLGGIQRELTSADLGPIRPKSSQMVVDDLRGMDHAKIPKVRFIFTDSTGVIWTRNENGMLERNQERILRTNSALESRTNSDVDQLVNPKQHND